MDRGVVATAVPRLEGERCVLRELHVTDAASLARHADNVAVWCNLFEGFPRPYTLADAQVWCDAARRPAAAGFVWGIAIKAGRVIDRFQYAIYRSRGAG